MSHRPLPRDQENYYTTDGLVIGIYYRVLGAAPGRLTCTVFVGSAGMHADPVHTSTLSGSLVSGGTREVMWMEAGPQTGGNTVTPNTLICAISPKTQLAGIYFEEFGVTDYVDPPA